ncbi:Hypothetical protein ETEE_3983 [Edwardsiella anguillarum ET080813]|uniref:Uncharacterized protein n=1 Tax=Edwardsiella anguillarum ET080813 TaxID=667120 RepID=A0A076LUP9_9GAMM|nr:Hypothetical protein ETEE_3983 [Edwardsiella anguillarum ET080813]
MQQAQRLPGIFSDTQGRASLQLSAPRMKPLSVKKVHK